MPNEDGTPTTDERLAAIEEKMDRLFDIFGLIETEKGKLDAVMNAAFACRCADMYVMVACKVHDFKVTYPNWTVQNPAG